MADYSVSSILAVLAPVAIKITCLILGYLVVRLGYQLLEKGVKGEFKFNATVSGARADLVSASPGLLFVLLGVLLIGYGVGVKKPISVSKTISKVAPPAAVQRPPPPDVHLPPIPRS